MPPRLPAPGRTSATVRTPGNQVDALGSLATSSRSSVTARRAAATRSMMRVPRMSSRPFGCPPNRVAWPPARMTPVTGSRSAATVVGGPEGLVLGDAHLGDRAPIAQRLFHALEDEAREILAARYESPRLELGHVEIDVLLVESGEHNLGDDVVECLEIDDESGLGIDLATDRHVAPVLVLVKVLARPRAVWVPVPRREPHPSSEQRVRH